MGTTHELVQAILLTKGAMKELMNLQPASLIVNDPEHVKAIANLQAVVAELNEAVSAVAMYVVTQPGTKERTLEDFRQAAEALGYRMCIYPPIKDDPWNAGFREIETCIPEDDYSGEGSTMLEAVANAFIDLEEGVARQQAHQQARREALEQEELARKLAQEAEEIDF